jgi:hypothetical protein
MTPSRGEARLKQALQGILDTASIANDPSPQYLDPFTEAKEAAAAAGIFSPRATKATVCHATAPTHSFKSNLHSYYHAFTLALRGTNLDILRDNLLQIGINT